MHTYKSRAKKLTGKKSVSLMRKKENAGDVEKICVYACEREGETERRSTASRGVSRLRMSSAFSHL